MNNPKCNCDNADKCPFFVMEVHNDRIVCSKKGEANRLNVIGYASNAILQINTVIHGLAFGKNKDIIDVDVRSAKQYFTAFIERYEREYPNE